MAVSEAFHLITAGLVKGEGGDLWDLCALDNSSINTLPGANSHLYWSHVERLGLRTLNCCVLLVCSSLIPKGWSKCVKQLQWFPRGSVGFWEAQKPLGCCWAINLSGCASESYERFGCVLFQEGVNFRVCLLSSFYFWVLNVKIV